MDGASLAAAAALTVRRIGTVLGVLLAVLVLLVGAGFAAFVAVAHRDAGPVPQADGIVALTGGADRVETALRLLAAGKARMLLVSGVAHGAGLHELARRVDLDPVALAPRVTLGRAATTTLGNAEETAAWLHEHDLHSLIVVTAGYHMPRAMLEMRRTMPGVPLFPVPVQPAAMRRATLGRLLVGEYAKLIGAWFGVSHLMRHRLATIARQTLWTTL